MADSHEKWYELYEKEGYTQAQIAEKYDVGQSAVSQGIQSYRDGLQEGLEQGRESVSPGDFETDTLKDELETRDEHTEEDTYNCGNCGAEVDYMGDSCPECGQELNWSGFSGDNE